MNTYIRQSGSRSRHALLAAMIALTAILSFSLHAAPGAHGPGGEHLDAPGAAGSAGNTSPRIESKSETFELVGRLEGGVLSILIDRFETNEPVMDANVDLESGGAKSKATFRSEQGDYVVTDPAMLKLLAGPGTHSMIFTISAGKDSDLLDGKLIPGSAANSHDAAGKTGALAAMSIAIWIAAVLGAGAVVYLLRRRQTARRFATKNAGGVR